MKMNEKEMRRKEKENQKVVAEGIEYITIYKLIENNAIAAIERIMTRRKIEKTWLSLMDEVKKHNLGDFDAKGPKVTHKKIGNWSYHIHWK